MMSKNGFSRCGEIYIGRLRKEGALFYGACLQECPPFFQPVLRHVQCVVQAGNPGTFTTLRTVSLRMWLEAQHRFPRICVCFAVSTIGEWKRVVLLTSPAYFTMSIRVWMSVRRRPFLLPSCESCFMKIPNRNVYAIHRLLPL